MFVENKRAYEADAFAWDDSKLKNIDRIFVNVFFRTSKKHFWAHDITSKHIKPIVTTFKPTLSYESSSQQKEYFLPVTRFQHVYDSGALATAALEFWAHKYQ